ncbi:MAG: 1,4-dihydroxy-2-naphthoate octaprenyltransferase [Muribaculum sp.]|nr:1,4-dihydroxy-2-naphthoate octaprenyltransferase [Muribaculum sp.]
MKKIGCWIEAMRLRTLPVSLAGVFYAAGLGLSTWHFRLEPLVLCFVFALLAQIASNFANEYYDYKGGLDKVGREGPRRGVTEGDITPEAMIMATFITLGIACVLGCVLVWMYGEWWMYLVGILTALGVIAYSSGPYPLSHHGLGEVAVICFFGIIPVCLTYYLQAGMLPWWIFLASLGIGAMGANVLIVNNYRDYDDDRTVGKRTLAVILGRRAMLWIYLINGFIGALLTLPEWMAALKLWWVAPGIYLILHIAILIWMSQLKGRALTPILGITATLMLLYSLTFFLVNI